MTKSVRQPSSAVDEQSRHWPLITALLGGTYTMRQAGETFMPQWPNEQDDAYKARLSVATLYPAFARTSEVLASKPFSKPVQYADNVPPRILDWMADCDLQGHNLNVFAGQVMQDCIQYGVSGVLVDYPPVSDIKTQAEEKQSGARPYFTRYAPGTVLGWRTERISGSEKLIQVRLLETVTEHVNEFEEQQVEQVRVLYRGLWQVWRKVKDKEDWFVFDEGRTTLSEIPFVFFYGIRKATGVGNPPLVELAYQNVEHWQSCSDQQTILHVARVPILALIGADDKTQLTVGASSAIALPLNADLKFVEHTGAAISSGRQSILDLEERMRQTGAELLVLKPGDVTATQVQSENEANRCTLQRITEDFEDSLDSCLQLMADWVGEQEGGNVSLFKDFGVATLGEASAELLLKSNQSGKISDETYFGELRRRNILSPDATWEDEQDKLGEQGPALGSMEADPAITPVNDPAPQDQKPEPVDLQPIMDAISAIQIPESSSYDDTAIKRAIADLSKQLADLSAKTDEPQVAEIDLSPIEQSIAALSVKLAEIEGKEPEAQDDSEIIAAISELSAKVSAMEQKPEQKPDLDAFKTAIVRDVLAAIPAPQPQPIVILDGQGQVKKQITIQKDANGNITGAISEPQSIN